MEYIELTEREWPERYRMDITAMDRAVQRYNLYINVYATGI